VAVLIADGQVNLEQWRGESNVWVPSVKEINAEMRSHMQKATLPGSGLGGECPSRSYRAVAKRRHAEALAWSRRAVG